MALELDSRSLAMNVDEIESLLKPCLKVQIEELNDEFGSMGGKSSHQMLFDFGKKDCPKKLYANGVAKHNCEFSLQCSIWFVYVRNL